MGFSSSLKSVLGSSGKLKTRSTLDPAQTRARDLLGQFFSSRVGQGLPQFEGQRVAGASPFEQQGLNTLSGFLGSQPSSLGQQQGAFRSALAGGLIPQQSASQSRDFFESTIRPRAQENFQRLAAPALDQAALSGGVSSSDFNRALANQVGIQSDALNQQEQQFLLQERALEQQRATQNAQIQFAAAQSQDPETRAQLAQLAAAQSQLAQLPRILEQAGLDANFAEFIRTSPEFNPVIAQALQFLGIQTQASFFGAGSQGLLGDIQQAVGAGAGILGGGLQIGTALAPFAKAGFSAAKSGLGALGGAIGGLFGGGDGGASQ